MNKKIVYQVGNNKKVVYKVSVVRTKLVQVYDYFTVHIGIYRSTCDAFYLLKVTAFL